MSICPGGEGTQNTYSRLINYRKICDSCPDMNQETETLVIVKSTKCDGLPKQSRPKPDPLTLTGLGLQYREARTYHGERVELGNVPFACSCPAPVGAKSGRVTTWLYTIPAAVYPSVPDPDWAHAMRNKMQNDKQSFSEEIGEWRDTVDMLHGGAGMLKRAYKAAQDISRGSKRRWRRAYNRIRNRPDLDPTTIKDVIGGHLAWQYGIQPTASTIKDAIEQLNRKLKETRRITTISRAAGSVTQHGAYGGSYTVVKEVSFKSIMYVTYDMDDRNFTSGNPAEWIWAGTRLSFMIDWFYDVGGYLGTFNALNGVKSWSGVVCKRERTEGKDFRHKTSGSIIEMPGTFKRESYQRSVISSLPYSKGPQITWGSSGDWGKLASAMEILFSIRN